MAAESPRRGSRCGGATVRPQPVSDKSVVESVVDFFQDVTQAYTHSSQKPDDREKVTWVKFEHADVNDINSNPDYTNQSGNIAPLLIILGYTNGIQIWTLPASGEAQEVLSLRQGPVRCLTLLPHPKQVFGRPDMFATKRPMMALSDASSAGQPYCCVKFVSLRTGDEVHNISFAHPVSSIKCNERIVIVAFPERIAAFDSCQFKQVFCVVSCYPSPCPDPNPIALGTRWLAYADRKLVPVHQSGGGMSGDGGQSYAATVISAAKTLTKGLSYFGETVASSLTGSKPIPVVKKEALANEKGRYQPGIVTIIDVMNVNEGQISVQEDADGDGLIAHFPAHASEPVAAMTFDPSGMLLITADKLGHNFHVFRIMAHPWSCSLGAVHHLYTLYRGDTTAKVQDICFTHDSRWVAISSLRGTTHVFPITPYGGPSTIRTHTSQRVVNRASRFHRSAGIEDLDVRPSGRHSPVHLSSSPGSSPGRHEHFRHILHQNTLNNNMGNPRLPPFPHPITVYPLVQIKQTLTLPGLGGSAPPTSGKGKTTQQTGKAADIMCVSALFARSRGWVAGSPSMSREKSEEKKAVDSLYIISWTGQLIEYVLDPHTKPGTDKNKVTEESPMVVTAIARAQWSLIRSMTAAEYKMPLPNNNPIIMGHDAVVTQRPTIVDLTAMGGGLGSRQESRESLSSDHSSSREDPDEQWLSQVEIITHAGPHRRLWMGPQFSFRTFQGSQTQTVLASNSSVLLSQSPEPGITTMDIVSEEVDLQSLKIQPTISSPIAMPGNRQGQRRPSSGEYHTASPATTTLLIEAEKSRHVRQSSNPSHPTQIVAYMDGSYEQSPSLLEAYNSWPETNAPVQSGEIAEERLRERLADAMIESPIKEAGAGERHAGSHGSLDNLSTSSGSGSSYQRMHSFDARSSPPHTIENVLVFPSGSGSPDSN